MTFYDIFNSLVVFLVLWAIGIVLLWFRPRIEIIWKIIATIIFAAITFILFDDIMTGVRAFARDWYVFVIKFFYELVVITAVMLLVFWPITLILIFYKSDDIGAERLLKFMSVLTLVILIILMISVVSMKGIDEFFFKSLKDVVPYAK